MKSNYRYKKLPSALRRKRFRMVLLLVELIVLFVFASFFTWFVIQQRDFLKNVMMKRLQLQPESEGFKSWIDPPVTTRRAYHLFNYSNWLEVIKRPDKTVAEIHDVPAFVYDLKTRKFNVTWLENNSYISYQVERIIKRHPTDFDSALINQTGFYADLIRALIRNNFEKKASQAFFSIAPSQAFQEAKAIDLLEGFNPPHFSTVQSKMIGPNKDKFGFVYRQNGSRLYNVTSQTRIDIKGEMISFSSELSSFKISTNKDYIFPVYDGLTFPADLTNKTQLFVFNSDFCRPVLLEFQKVVSKFGFSQLYEYKLKLIDHESCYRHENKFNCTEVEQLDVSKCFSDSLPDDSIFLSKAHFYQAAEETISKTKVRGFNGTQEKHDSLIYFEPVSGTPIQGTYRIQLNVKTFVDPTSSDRAGSKRFLPIFWIDQKVHISEETLNKLKKLTYILHNQIRFLGLALLVLSMVFIIVVELIARCCLLH